MPFKNNSVFLKKANPQEFAVGFLEISHNLEKAQDIYICVCVYNRQTDTHRHMYTHNIYT